MLLSRCKNFTAKAYGFRELQDVWQFLKGGDSTITYVRASKVFCATMKIIEIALLEMRSILIKSNQKLFTLTGF